MERIMKQFFRMAIAFACIILSTSSAFAARQDMAQLSGKVYEKATNEPLGWATVALMKADSTIVAGVACDAEGAYALQVAPGAYIMKVSLLGYADHCECISLKAGKTALDPIYLDADTQQLASATLTERVKLVEMKIDKLVMNVSQSAFAQGSNALELMKKAPGVTIDKDGNVKLNGKTVSVWIDGRPSHADGKSLEALLRSTNGESIDKFEIMEHPSAKYDAEGQGGIINIKTKKNLLAGLNGSMGLGGGGMHFSWIEQTPWQQSSWLNLGYRTQKTNTFFSIYEGFYNTPMELLNTTLLPQNDFKQFGNTVLLNFYHNYNVKLGNDWFINDKNTIGFILYMPGEYTTMNSKGSTTEQWIADQHQMMSNSLIANKNQSTQYTANLNYTHIFDPARASEVTANLDYYRSNGKEHNTQDDVTRYDAVPDVVSLTNQSIDATKIYDIYSAKADYQSVVFQKYMLEAGAKWALSMTDNDTREVKTAVPDNLITFGYKEHIGAGYVSMAGQLGPKVSAKVGLRGEYTYSKGDWISAGRTTQKNYFDLFPTVYLGYTPSADWRLSTSYSRRISRPNYTQLNPNKTYIDSRTYIVGNPEILPQYSDDVNFVAGYGQHLSLVLGYNHTGNTVTQIPSYSPDGNQYLTWDNYGTNRIAVTGLSIAALPVGKFLQWTASANGIYINSVSEKMSATSNCFGGQVYTALSFLFPKNWKLDWDATYSSRMRMANYDIHPVFYSDLALKKSCLDDRMNITLSVNDIFRSRTNDIDMIDQSGSGAISNIGQKYYTQKVLLDITWSFGKAKQTRQRKVGNLEEMSRTGGSGLGK